MLSAPRPQKLSSRWPPFSWPRVFVKTLDTNSSLAVTGQTADSFNYKLTRTTLKRGGEGFQPFMTRL